MSTKRGHLVNCDMVSNDMLSTLMKLSEDLGSNQTPSKLQTMRSSDGQATFNRVSKAIKPTEE